MEIIPALDLRQGKCVRLYQGDYGKETVFSHEPVAIALRWQAQGAKRLHLIDLDGAAEGKLCNEPTIKEILKAVTGSSSVLIKKAADRSMIPDEDNIRTD